MEAGFKPGAPVSTVHLIWKARPLKDGESAPNLATYNACTECTRSLQSARIACDRDPTGCSACKRKGIVEQCEYRPKTSRYTRADRQADKMTSVQRAAEYKFAVEHLRECSRRPDPPSGVERNKVIRTTLLKTFSTFIHASWPIYGQLEAPSTMPRPLILSMMSAGAIVPTRSTSPFTLVDIDNRLYKEAQRSLTLDDCTCLVDPSVEQLSIRPQIINVQALLCLGLRALHTSNGVEDALPFSIRACNMVSSLLGQDLAGMCENLAARRSVWGCFVLDKLLAVAHGGTRALPSSSIHLVDYLEGDDGDDELDYWPPKSAPPAFSDKKLASASGQVQAVGHVLSCFAIKCEIALILERILDAFDDDSKARRAKERADGSAKSRSLRINPEASEDIQRDLDRQEAEVQRCTDDLPMEFQPHWINLKAWRKVASMLLTARELKRRNSEGLDVLDPALFDDAPVVGEPAASAARQVLTLLESIKDFANQCSADIRIPLAVAALTLIRDGALRDERLRDLRRCIDLIRGMHLCSIREAYHRLHQERALQALLSVVVVPLMPDALQEDVEQALMEDEDEWHAGANGREETEASAAFA